MPDQLVFDLLVSQVGMTFQVEKQHLQLLDPLRLLSDQVAPLLRVVDQVVELVLPVGAADILPLSRADALTAPVGRVAITEGDQRFVALCSLWSNSAIEECK